MKIVSTSFKLSFIIIILFNFNIFSQNLANLLSKGDSLAFINFNYEKALDLYNEANKKSPDNPQILNRISRTLVKLGETLPNRIQDIQKDLHFGEGVKKEKTLNKDEIASAQIDKYQKAFEIADRSVKLNPKSSEAYLRRAVANAQIALTKGIFSVASIVNQVKKDLEIAIKLDNGGNDIQAYAHYVLARVHDQVSNKWKPARTIIGLGWADKDTALKEYKIAIKLKPNVRRFYLDYAKALLEEDEENTAVKILSKVEKCPVVEPEDNERLIEAKQILDKLM